MTSTASPGSAGAQTLIAVGALTAAAVMDGLNATIFDLAGDHMAGSVSATPDEAAWLNLAYFMAKVCGLHMTALLLTWLGTRRLLSWAILLLMVGSAGCWLAPNLGLLVICRAPQGGAGAAILAGGQSWLFGRFRRDRQGLIQAFFALGAIMAPTTAAPALVGVITDAASWNFVLLLNLPVGLLVLAAMPLIAPRRAVTAVRPDWLGIALLCIGLPAWVYVLVEGSRWDWFEDTKIIGSSLTAGAALSTCLLWQLSPRNRSPLIDLKILRHEEFAFGFVVSFVAGFALFGSAFLIPAFTLQVLQFPARDAGLALLPGALTVGLGLLTSGSVIQCLRAPPVVIVPFGIGIFMTAMWLLSGSSAESGYPDLLPILALRGFGMGLLFVAITIICLGDLTGAEIPHGVGLFNLGRQLGGLIGVAFLSTFLDRHMALSRTALVAHLGSGNWMLAQAQYEFVREVSGRGLSPQQAQSAALATLDRLVNGQAAAISFNEAFLSLALLFVVQGSESRLTQQGSEHDSEISGIPPGGLSPELYGVLVFCGSDEVDGEVSDDGHVFCAMTFAQARLVVFEDDVQHPMKPVFDSPVTAHGVGGLLGGEASGRDIISGLLAAAVGKFGARIDPDDAACCGQA